MKKFNHIHPNEIIGDIINTLTQKIVDEQNKFINGLPEILGANPERICLKSVEGNNHLSSRKMVFLDNIYVGSIITKCDFDKGRYFVSFSKNT